MLKAFKITGIGGVIDAVAKTSAIEAPLESLLGAARLGWAGLGWLVDDR